MKVVTMRCLLSLLLFTLLTNEIHGSQMTVCKQFNSPLKGTSVKDQCAGQTVFLDGNVRSKGEKGEQGNKAEFESIQAQLSALERLQSSQYEKLKSDFSHLQRLQELCNCTNCKQPLGLENGNIPDSRITASSIWGRSSEPYRARLNNKGTRTSTGAWIPKGYRINGAVYNLHFDPPGTIWIQVHLNAQQYVTGIITQGRPSVYKQFVTSYNIKYSDDGVNFTSIPGTFKGNNDSHTPVTEYFPKPILTSYIRLYPMTWEFAPTLRMELLGCNQ